MRWLYPYALLLALWWLVARLSNPFVTPSPRDALARVDGELLGQAGVTLTRVLSAFALALVAGVALGALIGTVAGARRALRPLVQFMFPVPKVALYPALLILLGLGSPSKVALGALEAVFPVALATAAGTSRVSPRLRWSAASLGTRRPWLKVTLPAALPAILTGARIGLVGGVIGVFIGELIAGPDGLGHVMAVAYRTLDTPAMYAAIVCVSVLGFALDRALVTLRARLLAWSPEER